MEEQIKKVEEEFDNMFICGSLFEKQILFPKFKDFLFSHLQSAYQQGQEDEAVRHQKEDLKAYEEGKKEAKK